MAISCHFLKLILGQIKKTKPEIRLKKEEYHARIFILLEVFCAFLFDDTCKWRLTTSGYHNKTTKIYWQNTISCSLSLLGVKRNFKRRQTPFKKYSNFTPSSTKRLRLIRYFKHDNCSNEFFLVRKLIRIKQTKK